MPIAFALALIAVLAAAVGQTPAAAPSGPGQWTPGPPPEMSRLRGLVGTWQVRLRTATGRTIPASDPWTVEPILDGTTLRIRGTYPQVGTRLEILLCYDRFNAIYRMAVADNQSAQLDIYEGTWDGRSLGLTNLKTGTFITDPAGGPRQFVRLRISGLDSGAPAIATQGTVDAGASWLPESRLEFTRRP